MKLIKLFLIVLTIASLYGCTHVIREPLPQIKVAILPMDNQTTNMDGPRLVREKFYRRMQEKYGYITQPIEETDALLKEMGITDGGQLNSVKPQDVGKKLNVDALIYGNLLVFKPVRVSLGAVLKVSYRMLDTNTGGTLWETEDGISALSKINPNESMLRIYKICLNGRLSKR
ncbi:MAG: GNA1162 family protein [Elusimicrobiota bacterium]